MLDWDTPPCFRHLDWDKLKSFYYVAKLGNISHAAQFLNLTQSSFSRHISALERQLGYPLFSRDRDGVTLTHRGKELFEIVEKVFFTIKAYTSRMSMNEPLKPGQRRKIRIAANHALASYFITNLILQYNMDHPEFVFEILEMDQPIDVILYNIDIAIQPYQPTEGSNLWQIIQEPCFSLKVKLYASSRYLHKYGKPRSIEDLKDHKFIFPSIFNGYLINDSRRLLEIARDNNIKKHNLSFLSNSVECLIEAAQQDKGIISVYENMRIIKNANLINVLPELTIQQRDEFFVYPKYLKDDKDIINIKDFLTNRINSTCG